MEAEARDIHRDAAKEGAEQPVEGLGTRIAALFAETAILMAARRAAGRPAGFADAIIAGIDRTRRATSATRNVRRFADAGIAVVDPWSA